MARIQLAHSYFLRFDQKQWDRGKPYPPLATIQVAAMLRQLGHRVSLFDAMLAEGTGEFAASLRESPPARMRKGRSSAGAVTKWRSCDGWPSVTTTIPR